MEQNLLDEKQAAEILTIEPGTLSVWRSTGRYKIPFIKVGRRVRYRRADLDAWLESRVRASGATA
jgi:excisionase family DNA binding protein